MTGYITKGIGGFYYVKTSEGIVECKPRGIFRKQKITPVAGDVVTLETENGGAVSRGHRAPAEHRSSARPWRTSMCCSSWQAHPAHPQHPRAGLSSRPSRWTRASSPSSSAPKAISPRRSFCAAPTKNRPCPSYRIDYATGEGLDDIRHWINGRLCAFCGNSGVGKSTLLNVAPARRGAPDRRHQPEAGPWPSHHPRGDHL